MTEVESAVTKDAVIAALKTVEDPELFLDIWFLGLVYEISIDAERVEVEMTFTSPMCPAGPLLIEQVKEKVGALEGVKVVDVRIVFNPPWQPSDEVKLTLGLA
jgi:metal-sulfur cluster biosynthetic enzyme